MLSLDPKAVRGRLARILPIIEAECNRNPAFAAQIKEVLDGPGGIAKEAFDPFDVYSKVGEAGLKSALEKLDQTALSRMVGANRLDPSRLAQKWKDRDRLLDFIVERIRWMSEKDSAFLTKSESSEE